MLPATASTPSLLKPYRLMTALQSRRHFLRGFRYKLKGRHHGHCKRLARTPLWRSTVYLM